MRDLSMAALMGAKTTTARPARVTAEGLSEELARKEAEDGIVARYERAETDEDRDRILAELVEEGHADALISAYIIDEDEAANLYHANPPRYEELGRAERAILRAWIEDTFMPGEGGSWHHSYALKHDFERSRLGFYVSEGQFKGAMREAGYEPSSVGDFPTFGWRFKIRRPGEDTKWLEVELREKLGVGPPVSDEERDGMCWYVLAVLGTASPREWLEESGMGVDEFVPAVVRLAGAGRVERSGEGWRIREEL